MRKLLVFLIYTSLLPLFVCGCDSKPSTKNVDDVQQIILKVDSVKHIEDPKGNIFGPWLTQVFHDDRDKPVTMCGWKHSISASAEPVTLFYQWQKPTPEHSECLMSLGVYSGSEVSWNDGDPKTQEQLVADERKKVESQRDYMAGTVIAYPNLIPPVT